MHARVTMLIGLYMSNILHMKYATLVYFTVLICTNLKPFTAPKEKQMKYTNYPFEAILK